MSAFHSVTSARSFSLVPIPAHPDATGRLRRGAGGVHRIVRWRAPEIYLPGRTDPKDGRSLPVVWSADPFGPAMLHPDRAVGLEPSVEPPEASPHWQRQ